MGVSTEGFEEAFERLFARAYHVAFRILGHSGEAEDVAAEALARTLDSWKKVRSMQAPDGWVVRVATNLAIDVFRRRKWVDDRIVRLARPEVVSARGDDTDVRVDLHELLRLLPQRQREVLALRYLADLSEAETAAVLGIAQGTVKRHANRGITRMREEVASVAS